MAKSVPADHRPGESFTPINLCRGCSQPTLQCACLARRQCPRCNGRGWNCYDDLCRARGRCMHDGTWCSYCEGEGVLKPERVLVCPDPDAAAIRDYVRDHPELVHDDYQARENPLAAACYPAAEAYYHLCDRDPEVYCLNWADVDEDFDGTHWYLREPAGERRWIDLSLPLMPPVDLPPFEQGTHRGFLTGDEPSERAQQVLAAVTGGDGSW